MTSTLVAPAQAAQGLHYKNPRLPVNVKLPDNLECGTQIYIHGAVKLQATRFSVNLKDGPLNANTYFHFNPRFGDDNIVVRNSRLNDVWGEEEREGDNPFTPGENFLIRITPAVESYEVEVNGNLFTLYKHRDEMPLCNVTHLTIKGDVVIYGIHVPIGALPIPLVLSIPGKTCAGDMLFIKGEVPSGSDRFAVNLQCGDGECADIMFHLNPRFGDGAVVCNSRNCDAWDNEEREGNLPISPGDQFCLCITASSDCFQAFVNGSKLIKFNHRLNMSSACTLRIEGDISVRDICFDSPPVTLSPKTGDEQCREYENLTSEVFFQANPAKVSIPNSLQPGKAAVITGVIDNEPSRFLINLQCGAGEESDIALHINPRWDSYGGPALVMNSRLGGTWGDEVVEPNKMAPGAKAEVSILCKDDAFSVSIDGEVVTNFPHRMDCRSIDHVVVDGSFSAQRISVA